MATNLTSHGADVILMHVFRAGAATAYAQPATVYVSLHTADPTKSGSVTNEVSGGSYARTPVTFGAISTVGTGDTSTEHSANSLVTFPQASAAWGTITHVGIHDAASGAGNMLAFGPLATSKIVGAGDTFSFPAGDVTLDLG